MSFQVERINKSETVEINILNLNSRQYKFSDNETTLDKVVLMGIAINTESLVRSFSGKTVLPNANVKQGYLTLATPETQLPVKRLPLETFFQNNNFITFFTPRVIDLRKSYIDFPTFGALALPADNQGFAIPVTIFYRDILASDKIGSMGEVLSDY